MANWCEQSKKRQGFVEECWHYYNNNSPYAYVANWEHQGYYKPHDHGGVQNESQTQSQADQEINKHTYREIAQDFWKRRVPTSYHDIQVVMGFAKTNKTVRKVFAEMTLLDGSYEDPSLFNSRWMRAYNYKENVKIAIELLSSYPSGAYPCANDDPCSFEYDYIKTFTGAVKTNNTVRAIAAILEEERMNPWDIDFCAYTLKQYVYYPVALRLFPATNCANSFKQ
jgi:hypothetical protein